MREHVPEKNPRRDMFEPIVNGRMKYLAIVLLVLFLAGQYFEFLTGQSISRLTGIQSDAIRLDFEFWRFFSYLWFHNYLLLLFVNVGALLLLGSYLEYAWSLPKLSGYFVFCCIIAGVCSFLFASPQTGLIGSTGGIIGFCLLCWREIPRTRLLDLVPMRQGIWLVGALVIVVHAFLGENGGDPNAAVAQLGGVLGGWIWIVLTPVAQRYYEKWKRYRRRKQRRERARLRRRMDELLEKISEEGLDALSEEERSTLQRASERLDKDVPDE